MHWLLNNKWNKEQTTKVALVLAGFLVGLLVGIVGQKIDPLPSVVILSIAVVFLLLIVFLSYICKKARD